MATSQIYYGNFGDADQPTLSTISDYVTAARTELQDTIAPYRYDDASMLTAFNMTLLEARRLRPDLFVWNLAVRGQVPSFQAVDDTPLRMEPQFRQALVYGLCGQAMARDQEDYQDARVASFMRWFATGLTGKAIDQMTGGSPPRGHPT